MTPQRVVIDACVLFPTVMREVVLGAAQAGLLRPLWSARILEEWARAAGKLGPAAEVYARGEVAALRARFPQAEVAVPEGLAARLWLPDAGDVHVLAAAVAASADLILTLNARDFPRNVLAEEGLLRADPDGWLAGLCAAHPAVMRAVVAAVVAEAVRLSGEDWDARRLLKKAHLTRLSKALARHEA